MTSITERCGDCGREFPAGSVCPCQNLEPRPGVAVAVLIGIVAVVVIVGMAGIVAILGGAS